MHDPDPNPELDATIAVSEEHTDPSATRDRPKPWSASDMSLAAETLAGRYELLGLLGSGGWGPCTRHATSSWGSSSR